MVNNLPGTRVGKVAIDSSANCCSSKAAGVDGADFVGVPLTDLEGVLFTGFTISAEFEIIR